MKTFLAVFLGSAHSPRRAEFQALDDATRNARTAAGMKAWGDWMQKHHQSLVVEGGPLGKTKRTSSRGVTDVRNDMGGFVAVRAETHEAAARMFVDHPHFSIFPGDAVEIMEILPVPER